jgi:hypothetical protein
LIVHAEHILTPSDNRTKGSHTELAYSIDGRTKVVYAVAFTYQDQLQNDLQQLEILEKKWQMQLNADKCFTIHLTKKRKT